MSASWRAPDIPLALGLDAWLDDPDWVIWVPRPFELRGGDLVASHDFGSWSDFRPAEHPWLASELAHVASDMTSIEDASAPSLPTLEAAHAFVNRYGLTTEWSPTWLVPVAPPEVQEAGPPLEGTVSELLTNAWRARRVLADVADGVSEMVKSAIAGSPKHPSIAFLQEAAAILAPSLEVHADENLRLELQVEVRFTRQVSIGDLAKLQLVADMAARRPVRVCQRRGCGKLFVWSKGRRAAAPARRAGLKGPAPDFCSYNHAQAERQARRLERGGS